MKEVVFVVAVHTTEGHKKRANIIRNELQLVEGETGEGCLREKRLLSHPGGPQPDGVEELHAYQSAK